MAIQMRIYETKPGQLDNWARQVETQVTPLRREHGFEILSNWSEVGGSRYVWVVEYPGDVAAFEAADHAYYELEQHKPLHEEALKYLSGSVSFFVERGGIDA